MIDYKVTAYRYPHFNLKTSSCLLFLVREGTNSESLHSSTLVTEQTEYNDIDIVMSCLSCTGY